jgi:hypothetical protein
MNKKTSSVLAIHLSGLRSSASRAGTGLARLLLVLGLLFLTLATVSFAEAPATAEPDMARLAALVRYYTDQHERVANAGSAQFRATSAYVREVLFADQFGGFEDPGRWAAVARFLTDRQERVANAGCSQYCALTKSFGGVERARVELILALAEKEP